MPRQLHGDPGTLMTLPLLKTTPSRAMPASKPGTHLFSRQPHFGGVLDSKPRQFVGLLHGDLLAGRRPGDRVRHASQRMPAVSIARHHGGEAAGMPRIQRRIHGSQCLTPLRRQRRILQIALGGMDVMNGPAARPFRIKRPSERLAKSILSIVRGLSDFGGFLARPVQGTRYRSRSKSLPLSRSSQ